MDARLEIRTLGGLDIRCGDEPLSALTSRKAAALLVYVVYTKRPQPREVLAELFWRERTQAQALS